MLLSAATIVLFHCAGPDVKLEFDAGNPSLHYAAGKIRQAVKEQERHSDSDYALQLSIAPELGKEAFQIENKDRIITIKGGDAAGLVYGAFSVVEDIRNGLSLAEIQNRRERPHFRFRAIKFNLPWDSYRKSEALSLHTETVRSLEFWEKFLDMMAENRFNAITLWNLHPFNFMVRPKNFPEACEFGDEELAEWQNFFKGLFRMAKERGLDTYIVNWNIFVPPGVAKKYQVALDNLDHHHFGKGDTSAVVKQYHREVIRQVFEEYPDLDGLGFSLGEMMGGMTPEEREQWALEVIIPTLQEVDRPVKLIHRVPFSADVGSGGSTSSETERMTRKALDSITGMEGPIWVEVKFNWSHAHSTPALVKTHGGVIHDTYWNPPPANYKITWMARNEDFFCLRWGQPDFIRQHIAQNTHDYVGGYFVGSECYIPAKDYFTKSDKHPDWTYAFERQWLFYKEWGRLLYNPETPDDVFRKEFVRRYGKAGDRLFKAASLASKMPLRLASYQDLTWGFTLYSEGFMAKWGQERTRFIDVNRLISNPPLDPNMISIPQFVRETLAGQQFDESVTTPLQLADELEKDGLQALELVSDLRADNNSALLYELADVRTWANLSLYFAEKLRGAVSLQLYRMHRKADQQEEAVRHLQKAVEYWDRVIGITEPIYKEMPLVHLNGSDDLYFHWKKLRPDVLRDVEIARGSVD